MATATGTNSEIGEQPTVYPDGKVVRLPREPLGAKSNLRHRLSGLGEKFAISTNGGSQPVWSRDASSLCGEAQDDGCPYSHPAPLCSRHFRNNSTKATLPQTARAHPATTSPLTGAFCASRSPESVATQMHRDQLGGTKTTLKGITRRWFIPVCFAGPLPPEPHARLSALQNSLAAMG